MFVSHRILTSNSELISLNLDKDGECQKNRNEEERSNIMFTCTITALYYPKVEEITTYTSGGTAGH
jgi:hypothetical protein